MKSIYTIALVFLFFKAIVFFYSCSPKEEQNNLILVQGGTFKNTKSNYYGKNVIIQDFYIGKYEVTQKEWIDLMGSNPSKFKGDNLPVEMVTWYDAILYCNKRSIKEGLEPFYNIDKNYQDPNNRSDLDDIKWTVTINAGANGYRLPTEAEWEFAASGGRKSRNYTYSGCNDVNNVAWHWRNSGDSKLTGLWNWPEIEKNNNKTKLVGKKKPNELGLYDMSGNVREWCWDWYEDDETDSGFFRVQRGGGWIGGEHACAIYFRNMFEANGIGPDQGFRVARNR